MTDIGKKLKELRERNSLTRKEAVIKLRNLNIDISDKTLYGYESGRNSANADMFLALCKIYNCKNIAKEFSDVTEDVLFTNAEWKIIEKYRALDADGQHAVDWLLNHETIRVAALSELERRQNTVIEFQNPHDTSYLAEYFRSASAGDGIFILGNEATAKISISESDWDPRVDYVIKVSGNSMEPDFVDGDNVMVSQHVEMCYGDVGIFIVNGKAYIKEYGRTELISRNPNTDNIKIAEYDNIVCMGKVIGKLRGKYEIIEN